MRELHDGIRELEEVDYDKSTLSDAVSRLSRLGLLTKLKDSEGGRRSKLIVSLNKPLPDWIADKLAKYVE
jgi:DNA-binding MarR family transcriptional regulator